MSGRRFKDLMAVIRFDDKNSRAPRRAQDKFAAIWEVFSIVNSKLIHHYIPGVNLTFDEHLMSYRGGCSFIQYLPLKPDKYGIKFFWIVDSSNYYPLKCIPYLGKEERNLTVGLATDITMELCRPFFGSNGQLLHLLCPHPRVAGQWIDHGGYCETKQTLSSTRIHPVEGATTTRFLVWLPEDGYHSDLSV